MQMAQQTQEMIVEEHHQLDLVKNAMIDDNECRVLEKWADEMDMYVISLMWKA